MGHSLPQLHPTFPSAPFQAPGHYVQLFRRTLAVKILTVNKHFQLVKNVQIGLEGNTTVGKECEGSNILSPTNSKSEATA